MSAYINSIYAPYKKILVGYWSVSFLFNKSDLDDILSTLQIKSNPIVIYSALTSNIDKWYATDTTSYTLFENVYMFPDLFELKFYGDPQEIEIKDIRDLKINFLINN